VRRDERLRQEAREDLAKAQAETKQVPSYNMMYSVAYGKAKRSIVFFLQIDIVETDDDLPRQAQDTRAHTPIRKKQKGATEQNAPQKRAMFCADTTGGR